MRIVFVNRFFFPDTSATSQLLSDLAFHVAGDAADVVVIASRQRIDQPRAALAPRQRIRGVEVHRVWSTRFGRARLIGRAIDYSSFYLSATIAAARLTRRGDLLVAATDPPMVSVPMALIARLRGAGLVNWVHDLFPEIAEHLGVRLGPVAGWLRLLRDHALRAARCNVVLGERMAQMLSARGVDGERIRVIHNWSDAWELGVGARGGERLRQRWGLEHSFVVGYSGNMGRAHPFQGLIDAAEELRDEAGICFLFIGDGARARWIVDEARKRGLANVHFQPLQPRRALADTLAVADVHVVCLEPRLEGLMVPSKLYGIAAAARPCLFLGAADGEVARVLAVHDCGVTLDPTNGAGIAAAIRRMAADRRTTREMGLRARRALEQRFERRHAMRAWEEVLGGSSAGG